MIGGNQILLNGITPEQLANLLRPMIRDELRNILAAQDEKLLSPAETCKLFKPAITKATLTSWTKQGLIQDHRLGGRVFYLQSEVLEKTLKLSKYKGVFDR